MKKTQVLAIISVFMFCLIAREVRSETFLAEILQSFRPKSNSTSQQDVIWNIIEDLDTKSDITSSSSAEVASSVVEGLQSSNVSVPVQENVRMGEDDIPLRYCWDEKLTARFLCNSEWGFNERDNDLFLVISAEPLVTITISKIDDDLRFVHQLTRERLEAIGLYRDGFVVEDTRISEKPALRVKAFSKRFPQVRLSDYYFVHNNTLYGLFFSVNPGEKWDDFKYLFDEIAKSFTFEEQPETDLTVKIERHNILNSVY